MDTKKLHTYIQYNKFVGYKYVPNLYIKIKKNQLNYTIETDDIGFRNSNSVYNEKNMNLLIIGDSYLAGDRISNHERFLDILSQHFSINTFNRALSGSGADIQVLLQEEALAERDFDAVFYSPFPHHIYRNIRKDIYFVDFQNEIEYNINKPYYELLPDGTLRLNNYPVPKHPHFEKNTIQKSIKTNKSIKIIKKLIPNRIKKIIHKLRYVIASNDLEKLYADKKSYEWQLFSALIEKMILNTNQKPFFMMPIPLYEDVLYKRKPAYIERFREFSKYKNVIFIDLHSYFTELSECEISRLYIPNDGHLTVYANQLIAQYVKSFFTGMAHKKEFASSTEAKRENYILGISCFYHDAAVTLIKNGEIIAAAQEERFTRIKHDKSFPVNSINYCMEEAKINEKDITAVIFYDNDSQTLERDIYKILSAKKYNLQFYTNTIFSWITEKSSIREYVDEEICNGIDLYKVTHHRAHAASAFYPSPFDEALILVVDGVGEFQTTSISYGIKNKIQTLRAINFPHSLGLLYSAITYFCGFKVNSGEYKLMGLAPYGKPTYTQIIKEKLISIYEDGSFELNLDYFGYVEGESMITDKMNHVFDGPPRKPETSITQRECDIARSIQEVLEDAMLKIADYAYSLNPVPNLVMAGGVALNCVATGKLLKDSKFKNIWVQPAAGDAGGSLGAALEYWHNYLGNQIQEKTNSSFLQTYNSCLGPKFSNLEIKSYLDFHNYAYHSFKEGERGLRIAKFLDQGKIIGHFDGRMEFGPRALGNRSILADARSVEMQSSLNLKIKFRESFRPFAPIVLEEDFKKYFDIPIPSPYMLIVGGVQEHLRKSNISIDMNDEDLIKKLQVARSNIPAITHVDYSARIQTINYLQYPNIYDILREFKSLTGESVLVNTSFNVRGEPIVCTYIDAYQCFMRTNMDVLVLNDFYLLKEEQPQWKEQKDWRDEYALD